VLHLPHFSSENIAFCEGLRWFAKLFRKDALKFAALERKTIRA